MIFTKPGPHNQLSVFHENGKLIGHAYREIDGFYVFVFRGTGPEYGFWEARVLRAVADKLDELNLSWQDEVERYFEGEVNRAWAEIDLTWDLLPLRIREALTTIRGHERDLINRPEKS